MSGPVSGARRGWLVGGGLAMAAAGAFGAVALAIVVAFGTAVMLDVVTVVMKMAVAETERWR